MSSLHGEILDRPPVALWRHFPVDDQQPGSLAAATLHFQRTYEFDLVKVTPASSFCLKDWGVEDVWHGNIEGTRDYTKRIISKPQDWETLARLEPNAPHQSNQLECLRLIRQGLGSDTPMLQTIFSPLAQAKNLAGNDTLLEHIRYYPDAVLKGLEIITQTTIRFIDAAFKTGIDGIFYAVQHAQKHLLTWEDYNIFGLPFDRHIMLTTTNGWCNMLHLHGRNVYFDLVSHLPARIVNWHDRETAPTLIQAAAEYDVTLCGGLRQETLMYQDSAAVAAEAAHAINQTGGRNMILSTGCVVPVIAPHGNYIAARRSVETSKTNGWIGVNQ